jgi:ATP-binding protein involved in chromosome partitioning
MAWTKDDVQEALRSVIDPELHRDLVTLGAVRKIAVCDDHVSVTLCLAHANAATCDAVRVNVIQALGRRLREEKANVVVEFVDASGKVISRGGDGSRAPSGAGGAAAAAPGKSKALPGVARIIAVGAGKGGVGKSTVAVNLAVGLARRGHSVGLMDGDIYGPSLPTLLGLDAMEAQAVGSMLQPFYVHGVKAMTMGKLVDPEKPLIWRGPMAHGAFKQLVEQTQWGELDYLVIDLPPGTGDVALTMAQMLSLDGAVVVCTPQKVAQDDAVRAARMFQQLGIEVLGVVENMSYFIGDDGKEYDIFGRGGAERMAQRLGVPFLGAIPIHMELRANSDAGDPTANFAGNSKLARELEAVVTQLEAQVKLASMRRAGSTPKLTVS